MDQFFGFFISSFSLYYFLSFLYYHSIIIIIIIIIFLERERGIKIYKKYFIKERAKNRKVIN
jgi:alpha-N-acetylglucosamine transferase